MKTDTLILHCVAIKKHGTAAEIARLAGQTEAATAAALAAAVASGRAAEAKGRYSLTPAAQMTLKLGYARDFAAARADADFMRAYEEFEVVNVRVKDLISAWQMMEVGGRQLPNDHSDPDHDAKIIDRLGDLHEKAEPMLQRLAAGVPRLAYYGKALSEALEKAEDGDIAWVSDVRCDSYHTVWFELHEDLLRIVGRDRKE
jgi:hypothetical protein